MKLNGILFFVIYAVDTVVDLDSLSLLSSLGVMASPSSTINFLPSEASQSPDLRRSPSPLGRPGSPLRYRDPGYGHSMSSLASLPPSSTNDPAFLQQLVVQFRAQVKQLQQERDEKIGKQLVIIKRNYLYLLAPSI